ncbi:MAG TPA: TIM barrel protein [Alphaproteobacteria bacterium]|nr:TIM barrel protein [Alphaproteobacteria bacterium]
MPRFCANVSMLFTELKLLDRFAAARAAGFTAVEIQFPFEAPLEDLARAVELAGVAVTLINFPAGDAAKGDRGLGALPGRVEEFRAGVLLAKRYAERLGARRINLLAGVPPREADPGACRATMLENMYEAARAVIDIGADVVIEAINVRDVPGFYVHRSQHAIELIDAAGGDNIAFQYDLYHMQIMEGDLIPTLTRLNERIGHIQFADTPGRHEPGTGEINYANVFAAIDRIGYAGFVGAEYRPSGATADSLDWFAPWRKKGA